MAALPGVSLAAPNAPSHPGKPLLGEELVVIVNASSGVKEMTEEEVIHIFMGRHKRLSNGHLAFPVEQVGNAELRARFYQTLMNVPMPQIRSYWARMWFSGQAQPPLEIGTSEEVIELVRANKGAIAFVERSKLVDGVKPVLVLRPKDRP
jgi:ABC-type phosphate transport system substrate-binding protein